MKNTDTAAHIALLAMAVSVFLTLWEGVDTELVCSFRHIALLWTRNRLPHGYT